MHKPSCLSTAHVARRADVVLNHPRRASTSPCRPVGGCERSSTHAECRDSDAAHGKNDHVLPSQYHPRVTCDARRRVRAKYRQVRPIASCRSADRTPAPSRQVDHFDRRRGPGFRGVHIQRRLREPRSQGPRHAGASSPRAPLPTESQKYRFRTARRKHQGAN